MRKVTITRFAYTHMGTFGKVRVEAEGTEAFECFTVERPWVNNEPFESCIPEGEYVLELGRFERGGYPAYEVMSVPGRTLIKIHRGNTMLDLLGCIAPGLGLGWVSSLWAVTSSRRAFHLFMQAMNGEDGHLIVTHFEV